MLEGTWSLTMVKEYKRRTEETIYLIQLPTENTYLHKKKLLYNCICAMFGKLSEFSWYVYSWRD